jgi:predicted TIM-barrel fold metal-dependent hydrolase
MDRYIVVSSDCHAGLPMAAYRNYLEAQYLDLFDQLLPIEQAAIDEKNQVVVPDPSLWSEEAQRQLKGAWDHALRIQAMDQEGIAAEVIFPDGKTHDNAVPFGGNNPAYLASHITPELRWAGARAHNRWLAEFCSLAPERRTGAAIIPLLDDMELVVQEARWAIEHGLRSILLPLRTEHTEPYHHPRYNVLWEICQDLEIVINFHSGDSQLNDYIGKWPPSYPENYIGGTGLYLVEAFFWTVRPVIFLIWGGVFERFPKLKVVVTEAGPGWILPSYLKLMDYYYSDERAIAELGNYTAHLSMQPTEYFHRNVGIGSSICPRIDIGLRPDLTSNQLMWGSDYPHPEGSWPDSGPSLIESLRGIPEAEVAAILGENAIRFYNFNRAKLLPIAAGIGPQRSEFLIN